jgi:hypothetical protein
MKTNTVCFSEMLVFFTNLSAVTYRKTLANLISEYFTLIESFLTITVTFCISIHYHHNHWLYTLRTVYS